MPSGPSDQQVADTKKQRFRAVHVGAYALCAFLAAAVVRVATRGRALWKLRNLRTCPQSLQTPRLLAPLEFSITQWWAHLAFVAIYDPPPLPEHNLPHF